ncbi:MAG: hypothetical protein U0359_09000 [Byssovorax sp.]
MISARSSLALPTRRTFFCLGLLSISALAMACSSSVSPGGTGGGGTGGGGTGGSGGQKPITCTWTPETSNATCPAGPCPITLDQALTCDDLEFGAPGVRVAPAPDGTWLATSSSNDRQVYRIANGQAERQDGVPKEYVRTTIALALGPEGKVHLAADTTTAPDYVGGIVYATLDQGAWTSSVAFDNKAKYTPVVDLEVGADGVPLLWAVTDAPDHYDLLRPAAPGGWTVTPAKVPEVGAWNRFTRASDGSLVALAFKQTVTGGEQLHALVGDQDRTIGTASIDIFAPDYAVAAGPAPGSPGDVLFAVAMAYEDGIHVYRVPPSGPPMESVIPGVVGPIATCKTPEKESCTGATCHETGVGMEDHGFALAFADDGTAYLAYVITAHDQTISYSLQGDPGIEDCWSNVSSDSSKATLHLVRIGADDMDPKEVLTMPIERPGGTDAFSEFSGAERFFDMRAYDKELAIGLRTGWVGGPYAVRVIRLTTGSL